MEVIHLMAPKELCVYYKAAIGLDVDIDAML